LNELEDDFLEYFELFEADNNPHEKARELVAKKYKLSIVATQKLLDQLGYYELPI
jgi:hypothetical protein